MGKKHMVSRGNHLAKAKEEEGTWSICQRPSPYLGVEHKGPAGAWCRVMLERPAGPEHEGLDSILKILNFFFNVVKHHYKVLRRFAFNILIPI